MLTHKPFIVVDGELRLAGRHEFLARPGQKLMAEIWLRERRQPLDEAKRSRTNRDLDEVLAPAPKEEEEGGMIWVDPRIILGLLLREAENRRARAAKALDRAVALLEAAKAAMVRGLRAMKDWTCKGLVRGRGIALAREVLVKEARANEALATFASLAA